MREGELGILVPVQGVSFPRAGHHLLERGLSSYFGCLWRYCENYNHCGTTPCSSGAVYSKSHDFRLRLSRWRPPYLIQTRALEPVLQSWFDSELAAGQVEDTPTCWQEWRQGAAAFWRRWQSKWIAREIEGSIVIHYERLVAEPHEQITRAVQMFEPGTPDRRMIDDVVTGLGIGVPRDPSAWRYAEETWH